MNLKKKNGTDETVAVLPKEIIGNKTGKRLENELCSKDMGKQVFLNNVSEPVNYLNFWKVIPLWGF